MSAPTTLPLGVAFSRSGVKGGDLPRLATNLLQGVVVFADYSTTLTGEPIEARAIGGGSKTGVISAANFQLISASPGGVVVQDINVDTPVLQNILIHRGSRVALSGPLTLDKVQLGGIDVVSFLESGEQVGGFPSPFVLFPTTLQVNLTAVRWYVPPGDSLLIGGTAAGEITLNLTWRELPEPLGSP